MTERHAVFRKGKVHVMAERCATCIFRPGNLMHLKRGRVASMVRAAKRRESCIPCHETTHTRAPAVCRGFFDRHATAPLQIAERLGYVEFDGRGSNA